jgi:plasmid maintenance system antidote protein VapI
VGKRYTKEEISRIQVLTEEGLSINEIALQLGRPEAGVRNIRYRMNLKQEKKESLQSLSIERRALAKKVSVPRRETASLQTKKQDINIALAIQQQTLETKLKSTLRKLKHEKPELFEITEREQITKLTGQLIGSCIRYLITE